MKIIKMTTMNAMRSASLLFGWAVLCASVLLTNGDTTMAEENAGLKIGDDAPAFKLKASDGKTYELADFKDKKVVVVAWFPKVFTGG